MQARLLTKQVFEQALAFLKKRDTDIENILSTLGPPPLRMREPGFAALVYIILEQQVSLTSAKAVFDRLSRSILELAPVEFLKLDADTLRQIGFSRQKTRYCRNLAHRIIDKSLDLNKLEKMDDSRARAELLKVTGIGRWTADIYLLTALRRADIWPNGDLALAVAVQRVKRLHSRPTLKELEKISEPWKPWRAVAAMIFWHYYLNS